MLKTRLLTVLVLLPGLLAALFYLPPLGWEALLLGVVLLAASEWGRLAGLSAGGRSGYLAATLALVAGAHYLRQAGLAAPITGAALAFWLVAAPCWLMPRCRTHCTRWAGAAGWLVLVATWLAAVELRANDPQELLLVLGVVWVADSAAYFAGRAWGRHKLAPAISPGKTWEGVGGAFIGVAVYAWVCYFAFPGLQSWLAGRGIGLAELTAAFWLLTAFAILGDLYESQLKRQAGVKDSGSLVPGHGGVLDRIDSLTAALPAALALRLFLEH